MKRALAIAVALCTLGVAGFAQLSGKWEASLCLEDLLDIESTLTLNYEVVPGLTITSVSGFGGTGLSSQKFTLKGLLGPFELKGSMVFAPTDWTLYKLFDVLGATTYTLVDWTITGPAYKSSALGAKFDFGGIKIALDVAHNANYMATFKVNELLVNTGTPGQPIWNWDSFCYDKYLVTAADYAITGPVTVEYYDVNDLLLGTHKFTLAFTNPSTLTPASQTWINDYGLAKYPTAVAWVATWDETKLVVRLWMPDYMTYTWTFGIDPVSVKVVFDDVSTGIQFDKAFITLKDVQLCCGITYTAELAFNKCYGFDYLQFTVENAFEICCGISFDLGVKFTTTAKTVTVTPSFAGFGEACFEVYGDLNYEGGEGDDLYLNAIRIDGFKIECTLAECNTVEFVTFLSPEYAAEYGYKGVFDTDCGEFEYIGLGFCGASCCGGQYTVDLQIFFGTQGGLFDITRLVGTFSIPVMNSLSLDLDIVVPAATCATSSFCLGWTFTF